MVDTGPACAVPADEINPIDIVDVLKRTNVSGLFRSRCLSVHVTRRVEKLGCVKIMHSVISARQARSLLVVPLNAQKTRTNADFTSAEVTVPIRRVFVESCRSRVECEISEPVEPAQVEVQDAAFG